MCSKGYNGLESMATMFGKVPAPIRKYVKEIKDQNRDHIPTGGAMAYDGDTIVWRDEHGMYSTI